MTESWTLPGYAIDSLLGYSTAAEVWAAREAGSGELVALKRLRPGAGQPAVDALRREADLLCALASPYILGLRTVVGRDASAVLVLEHAPGGSLARLLGRRERLEPGEVVTVAVPLACALATAHARAVVHGRLTPSAVLFTGQGMALLTGFGGEGTAQAGRGSDAAGDVRALGALCWQMLTGQRPSAEALWAGTPSGLIEVVLQALSEDPQDRPTAADLAVALQQAEPARAVRLVGFPSVAELGGPVRSAATGPSVQSSRRPEPTRQADLGAHPPRPSHRWWRLVGIGCAAVLVLAAGGFGFGRSSAHPKVVAARTTSRPAVVPSRSAQAPPPVASASSPATQRADPRVVVTLAPATSAPALVPVDPPPAAPPDWRQVLADLDEAREKAFATGDPALLDEVYVEGSAARAADGAALADLMAQGREATGVRHDVRSVRLVSQDSSRTELRVVDVLGAQSIVLRSGALVAQQPPRGEAAYTVTLVRQGAGWRIELLRAA